MPAQGETVPLTFRAEIGNLRKELAKVPGITEGEAKKMAIALERQVKKAEKASKKAARASAKAQKRAAKESAEAWTRFGQAAATAAIAAAAGLAKLAQATADQRNAINDMSARTGIASKTLAGLQLAAEGSGLQLEDLNSVLSPLALRIGDVRKGGTEAARTFRELGVEIKDSSGEFLTHDQVLRNINARLRDSKDASERAAVAAALLGKSGGKLNQILATGDLDAYVDQAERYGVDIGPMASESAANFQRSMADLQLVLRGAASDFSDFLDATARLDGLVFALVVLRDTAAAVSAEVGGELMKTLSALSAVMEGDIDAALEIGRTFRDTDEVAADIASTVLESGRAFLANRDAIRASAAAASEAIPPTSDLGSAHMSTAAAAREQAAAEKALAGVFSLSMDAVDDLAASHETEAEALVRASQERISAILDEVDAIEEGSDRRLQAEIAASAGIEAIRRKLAEDMEALQLAELEEVTFPALDAEVEANQEAIDAMSEARAAAHERQIGMINEARDAAIRAAGDIATAVIDSARAQEEAEVAEKQAKLDGWIGTLEAHGDLTEKQQAQLAWLQAQKAQLALQDFKRQKRAQTAQALISGALLALTSSLPPPSGIGFPQGAIAAAFMTAAQVGMIASQKPPPMAHTGEVLSPPAGSPDEVDRRLKLGESVLNSRATQGNEELIREANRTGRLGGGGVTQVYVGGRAVSDYIVREMRGDGELARMTRSPAPQARRAFRG